MDKMDLKTNTPNMLGGLRDSGSMPKLAAAPPLRALKFSLILATVDRSDADLCRLFESLCQQTHQAFEVIIVDQNTDRRRATSLPFPMTIAGMIGTCSRPWRAYLPRIPNGTALPEAAPPGLGVEPRA